MSSELRSKSEAPVRKDAIRKDGIRKVARKIAGRKRRSKRPRAGTVVLRHVSKKYPLYDRPSQKLVEVLTFRRLRRHQEHWALRGIDLRIEAGTTLGIVGQNGSGKSTLLQLIAGILTQTDGICEVKGKVAALLELGAGFNPEFTGRENVYLNAAIQGLSKREVDERFDDILRFAEIGDFVERPVKTYSSGMFMRLAFAAAIHVEPDILLVDEALAVGDLIFQHRCINRIRRLREEGKTILFVTHDLQAITKFCDRAILLDHGKLLMDDTPDKVVTRYQELIFERERREAGRGDRLESIEQEEGLPVITSIPYIHNRYGEGRMKLLGVILHTGAGEVVNEVRAGEEVQLLISVRFHADVEHPIVGFTVRDQLGVEMAASNSSYEGLHLPPARAGSQATVAFRIRIPDLRPGSYSISPAAAQGNIWEHTIEDWIDNAYILNLADTGLVYGMMRWPIEPRFQYFG